MIRKIEETHNSRWFHYMTSWNYMLAVFYFVYTLVKLVLYKGNISDQDDDVEMANRQNGNPSVADGEDSKAAPLTTSDKVYYFLFSISYTMCFMVVVIFWFMLYKPGEFGETTSFKFFLTVDRHGIIFALILFQYVLNKISVRFLHATFVLAIALLFFVHTYFYYLATDKLVYTIFDWNKAPGKAIGYAFGLALACYVLQFVLFLIDLLKHKIAGNR